MFVSSLSFKGSYLPLGSRNTFSGINEQPDISKNQKTVQTHKKTMDPGGIEPPTLRLSSVRSNQLSYGSVGD